MAETMIASDMTDGQIDDLANKLRDAARKHRNEVSKDVAQQVLGADNLGMRLFVIFRQLAEAISNMIVRHVKVDRTKTPEQILEATGRRQYVDANVVKNMPKGDENEGDIYFFKPSAETYDENGLISDDNLEKEFELRGLKPVDPYKLSQFNADGPAFADEKPHGTHWKNADGQWCFAAFYRWRGRRCVDVFESGSDWGAFWWFAGLRK